MLTPLEIAQSMIGYLDGLTFMGKSLVVMFYMGVQMQKARLKMQVSISRKKGHKIKDKNGLEF